MKGPIGGDGALDLSLHSLGLLLGAAIAGVAALGAIAVGPYGRRGVRLALSLIAFAAFFGTAVWLWSYLGFIDQRRSIEARLGELRAQALGAGSALACLERSGEAVENACEQMLFSTPESLAAANLYTGARLDLLMAAANYAGPRTPQFDLAVAGLQRSLQGDPFGLTAHALVLRASCTVQRCESLSLFQEPERVRENIRRKAFETNVARYAGGWRSPAAASADGAASAPASGASGVPVPEKYTFPSASSIPPVSIMNDEPAERAPPPAAAPKDRSAQPAASAPPPDPPARREPKRQNAPLSITPRQ